MVIKAFHHYVFLSNLCRLKILIRHCTRPRTTVGQIIVTMKQMKHRCRIFRLCDGVSQQAINSQLTCFVNGNVHAYLLYYIHNIKQAVMLSKFCNYLNCILKILCWSLKLKNLATSLHFIGPHYIPQHFWIVLCSAPSVSQFFFHNHWKGPN